MCDAGDLWDLLAPSKGSIKFNSHLSQKCIPRMLSRCLAVLYVVTIDELLIPVWLACREDNGHRRCGIILPILRWITCRAWLGRASFHCIQMPGSPEAVPMLISLFLSRERARGNVNSMATTRESNIVCRVEQPCRCLPV